jgi:hypothetical protein
MHSGGFLNGHFLHPNHSKKHTALKTNPNFGEAGLLARALDPGVAILEVGDVLNQKSRNELSH